MQTSSSINSHHSGALALLILNDELNEALRKLEEEKVPSPYLSPVKYFYERSLTLIEEAGFSMFASPGEEFNKDIHKKVGEDSSPGPGDLIIAVKRPGWSDQAGNIIRPAEVIVRSARRRRDARWWGDE